MNKITAIGEILIDFICSDVNVDLIEGKHFIKKPGGAPANVCAAIAKLGAEASFVGKAGNDPFGKYLKQVLEEHDVDATQLLLDGMHKTTLAFVSLKDNGERDFIFNRGADEQLTIDEINIDTIIASKIIHLGSATALLGGPLEKAYAAVSEKAAAHDVFISFDPNFRQDLWKNNEKAFIERANHYLALSDFVKVSDDELGLLTATDDLDEGISRLHTKGAHVVAVTLGEQGTYISNGKDRERVASIPITPIDATGAGDAFVGAVLYKALQLTDIKEDFIHMETLRKIVTFANKAGAFVCTRYGAISALPSLENILAL